MRYSLNPEFDAQLKEQWDKIGLSREIQEALLQFMDAAALNMLNKECRRIARCLVDEGLSLEKIKSSLAAL
ncbi:MAG: hypothetical protein E6K54_08190 [Gammaproteobacteria bacterium]|nr:MAG: hypothetical protein E6K54_08190 [Gammaproteobacteria bacterium]